jgi:hypothetical protein
MFKICVTIQFFITLHAKNVPTIDFQVVQILTRKFQWVHVDLF